MSEKFVKEELFKPFTQEKSGARTQYKGTGLGMSIVKGLVEKMNGTIEVQSVPGQGSTFTVTLPFRIGKAEPSKEQETEQKQEKLLTGKRILLVEDNEINMEIAQFYLEDGGAAVDIAWNGAQAVNRFAASKEGYYDMILMDDNDAGDGRTGGMPPDPRTGTGKEGACLHLCDDGTGIL